MKIRLLTSLAGEKSYAYGTILTAGVEVSANDAERLVDRQLAEYADGSEHETATLKGAGVEKATTTHTRKRRG